MSETLTDALLVRFKKWVSCSTNAFKLILVDGAGVLSNPFSPEFTYTLFGTEERIFGYTGLEIQLYLSSVTLQPYIAFSYDEVINERGLKPQNVVEPLIVKFKPYEDVTFDAFMSSAKEEKRKIVGAKVHGYKIEDREFEVYHATFETAGFKEVHHRMQLLLAFFIEGATDIDSSDANWEIVTLYEKTPFGQNICGFITYYTYFCYPSSIRKKISQFMLLPPYQRSGHGSRLYEFLVDGFVADPCVADFGVEDPNDSFTDMRDLRDVERVLQKDLFKTVTQAEFGEKVNDFRRVFKLSKSVRVAEIVMFKTVRGDQAGVAAFEKIVKARIVRQNKDVLDTMERVERDLRVGGVFDSVKQDYKDVLARVL